jgi:hypothetical protein
MMKLFVTAAPVLLLLTSCAVFAPGRTVVKYEPDVDPVVTGAPESGQYALYSRADAAPKTTVFLEQGEEIGFRRGERGEVVAIAGGREIPLDADRNYYWHRQ